MRLVRPVLPSVLGLALLMSTPALVKAAAALHSHSDPDDNADAAEHDLEASQQSVKDANAAIAAAQQHFNTFAAATYMNGPSSSYLTASIGPPPPSVVDRVNVSEAVPLFVSFTVVVCAAA